MNALRQFPQGVQQWFHGSPWLGVPGRNQQKGRLGESERRPEARWRCLVDPGVVRIPNDHWAPSEPLLHEVRYPRRDRYHSRGFAHTAALQPEQQPVA
jgi:hypothetical protein